MPAGQRADAVRSYSAHDSAHYVLTDPSHSSDTTVGAAVDLDSSPGAQRKISKFCTGNGAWIRRISRENWHFNSWRFSFSESGPRLESRLLRQSALENVTNLSRTESPHRGGRNKSNHDSNGRRRAAADGAWEAAAERERERERRGGG
ncbi:callose synthase 8 [Dorcoceras hygrometricum]|uniref:Callose synthase 8 n=1 Tax=Dorcoceras hygrometricum TaxID=472368 RepID=A0A2Z7D057_9LAMI|nr:callose synthase 8 [Dorcoceras hygrometricum]